MRQICTRLSFPCCLRGTMFFRLILVLSLLGCVTSYKIYQQQIPNGDAVPFPCKKETIWPGVGHILDAGTGDRNQFGIDFAAEGYKWTPTLCQKDSDGDGLSNGAELGDPDCVWKVGADPNRTIELSHPGICDPWDIANCSKTAVISKKYANQTEWLNVMCNKNGLDCPAMKEPEVRTLEIRIDVGTSVPSKVTTYECQIFNLTELGLPNGTFHLIAVTPIKNNTNVIHHMILAECADDFKPSKPFDCDDERNKQCLKYLHVWAVGLEGECYHPQSGIRIGDDGVIMVGIQLHWNNPNQNPNYTDSSGFLLHYTPKLRRYDAGVLMIGGTDFQLPPKQEIVEVKGTCAGGCTQQYMPGPININSVWNHMHLTGRQMSIEVRRNNQHLMNLTNDKYYNYESPEVYLYDEPFVLLPGDEIITRCGFRTIDRNQTTLFGEGTQEEMCFGFITFYPVQNFTKPFCVDRLGISDCNPASWDNCEKPDNYFRNFTATEVYKEVINNCQTLSPCVSECLETIVKHVKANPCLQDKIWEFGKDTLVHDPARGQDF